MVKRTKLLGIISAAHITLGVFAVVLGIVALKVAPYYHGVFGMGIWLGGWILITGVVGFIAASEPPNYCKIGGFIGCSLVVTVSIFVSSIILGVGVLGHFKFETTVNREYYRAKGIGYESIYTKPQSYFDERNRNGRNGLGIYGSLLAVILMDIVINIGACFLCKEIVKKTQATTPPRPSRTTTRQPAPRVPTLPVFTLAAANLSYTSDTVSNLQHGFVAPTKLPSYGELYPEMTSPPRQSGQIITRPARTTTTSLEPVTFSSSVPPGAVSLPSDPPPAYTP